MNSSGKLKEDREQAFDRLVCDYYQAVEHGNTPSLQDLLTKYPDFDKELRSFFRDVHHLGLVNGGRTHPADSAVEMDREETKSRDPFDVRISGVIRDYRLLEKLGEGGMGVVYLAVHTQLEKRVAIKVLKGDRGRDASAIQRFRREIKAAGRFDHEHIVRALDAGQFNGLYYLVMEFIDGVDLSQLLHSAPPLTIADACELSRQSALGLEHAHQFGLIHRDVKPSNLMLTATGQVKLLDLGLAQLNQPYRDNTSLTIDGQAMGTLKYMAPEQFQDCRHVGATCDVYSLGITLFELLNGEFSARDVKAGSNGCAALLEKSKGVPAELADLVRSMTAVHASERLATAGDVAARLAPWSAGHDLVGLFELHRRCDDPLMTRLTAIPSPPIIGEDKTSPTAARITASRKWIVGTFVVMGLLLAGLAASLGLKLWTTDSSGVADSVLKDPQENTPSGDGVPVALNFPFHLPTIPETPGAWAQFVIDLSQGEGQETESSHYEITVRCLQVEVIEGIEHRWIQVEVLDTKSNLTETAWLLVDSNLYKLEQEFVVRKGFIQADIPESAGLSSITAAPVTVPWSNERDSLLQFSKRWDLAWPSSRVNTATALAILFDFSHPDVQQQYRDLRSRLATSQQSPIERSSVNRNGEIPSWRIRGMPDPLHDLNQFQFAIERAQDDERFPFSMLSMDVSDPTLRCRLDWLKGGLKSAGLSMDLDRLESAVVAWAELSPPDANDFSRASIPKTEGDWVHYGGTLKQGSSQELTTDVFVRAGAQEQFEGVLCRWIELKISSGVVGREHEIEGACLLVDEQAYADRQQFDVKRGWHQRGEEVFEIHNGKVWGTDERFQWLDAVPQGEVFPLQQALTILFDAENSEPDQLQHIRLSIQGLIVKSEAERVTTRKRFKSQSGKSAMGHQVQVVPQDQASMGYTIQWSHEIPFGFGTVKFSFPGLFEIYTELADYGIDHDALLGSPEEMSRRAEATMEKLSKLGVHSWSSKNRLGPLMGRYAGYRDQQVRIESRTRNGASQIESLRFNELEEADKKWIYEYMGPRKWSSNQGLFTRTAVLLGFSGVPSKQAHADAMVFLLIEQEERPANGESRMKGSWMPTPVEWRSLSEADQEYILSQPVER